MTLLKNIAKITAGLTLMYSLSNAQTLKTETDIHMTSQREGVRLHRTELKIDNVKFKYDAKTNLGKKDNLSDVGGIYIDNIVEGKNFNIGAAVTNFGNYDEENQVIFDSWINLDYDQWKVTFDKGHSIRKTAPLEFDILNVKYKGDINAAAQTFFISNDGSMYNGTHKEFHGYIAAGTDNITGCYAENEGISHVFGMGRTEDAGALFWLRTDRSKRDWSLRYRSATSDIDKKFFSYQSIEDVVGWVGQPVLYETHLKPGITRGNISLSANLAGTEGKTTVEVQPGMRFGNTSIGVGPYIERTKTTTTGFSAAAFQNVSVGKLNAGIEIQYKHLPGRNDVTGYVTMNYKF